MVIRENLKQKFALISVYDKRKLKYLCSNLIKYNYKLISTGSTGDKIRSIGFKCIDISKITKFKEMFDGRVKTLNPLIYGSLLYRRDNDKHEKQFLSLNVPEIEWRTPGNSRIGRMFANNSSFVRKPMTCS